MSEPTKKIKNIIIEFPDGTTQEAIIQLPTNQIDNLDDSIKWKNFSDAVNASVSEEEGE